MSCRTIQIIHIVHIILTVRHTLAMCSDHKCHGRTFNRRPTQHITVPSHRQWSNRKNRSTNCVTMKTLRPFRCPIIPFMMRKIDAQVSRKSHRRSQGQPKNSSIHNVAHRTMVMTTMAVSSFTRMFTYAFNCSMFHLFSHLKFVKSK